MKIFKFGGASVKDATAIRNVVRVLKHEGTSNTLVVVSAMGKMTNAFERVVSVYLTNKEDVEAAMAFVANFHQQIIDELFPKTHEIHNKVSLLLGDLSGFMIQNKSTDYNYVYDQMVCFGELLSTTIVSAYLKEEGIENTWLDVRELIKTDATYRDAKVDWNQTEQAIKKRLDSDKLYITQGFLGAHDTNTTTLGLEGSDYTAGIFAYCLNATNVTIWKDVPGVLNADPRVFDKTELLHEMSYTEAIEMAFYGASVIHPKTIQPLEQKNIPLYVRSFDDLTVKGTCVGKGEGINPITPCFIVKNHQTLISIAAKDFSFMVEENISHIFKKLHDYGLKANLIQNSAISFSVCVDDKFNNFFKFCKDLQTTYYIRSYHNVSLFTIRHFDDAALNLVQQRGKPILKQISTETAQIVIEDKINR